MLELNLYKTLPRLRMAMILGVIVVLFIMLKKVKPYFEGDALVFPICLTCHNDVESMPASIFRRGRTVCVDHLKMDGAKLVQMGFRLRESPQLPPFRYMHEASIEELSSSVFTKYEVFCAEVGRRLRARFPTLQTMRHTIVDHSDKRFVVWCNSSTSFVDAPIGITVAIKDLPRKKLFGYGGIELLRFAYGSHEDTVIWVKDWRFLHDKMNLNVDHSTVDMNGNEVSSRMVTILKTDKTYYAVGPTDRQGSSREAEAQPEQPQPIVSVDDDPPAVEPVDHQRP